MDWHVVVAHSVCNCYKPQLLHSLRPSPAVIKLTCNMPASVSSEFVVLEVQKLI